MRHVRFTDPSGYVRRGAWTAEGITFGSETYDPGAVDVLPPVEPTKIVCLGANYIEHINEGSGEVPDRPLLFYKAPNAVAGHHDTIRLPPVHTEEEWLPEEYPIELGNGRIDFEAELGVVIGEQCRHVAETDATDVIAGYTCVNDVSNRDDQAIESNWIRGKAFDGAAPMGPVVADPEHVDPDPRVRLWVNGDLKQDSADDEMVFSVPDAIAEITQYVTLEPGDVVSMGTTHGVGPLEDGDTVEIEIDGVGPRLEHGVEAATPRDPA